MKASKTRTTIATAQPRLRKRKADDPEQYERFREFAREVETDESPEAFDRVFRKVVPPKESPS